jgi:outer membrane protein
MPVLGGGAPAVPERPWHSPQKRQIAHEAQHFRQSEFRIDVDQIYSLADLIDLAEAHNRQTRLAWDNA